MQKLELPEALAHIRRKIVLLEQRLELITEGQALYESLAGEEADALKKYQYREELAKKQEEYIVYDEQLRSQRVYLSEFENDLKQQRDMRKQQLEQLKENLQPILRSVKSILKNSTDLQEDDRTLLKALRDGFVKNRYTEDDEKISRFRELISILRKYQTQAA